MNRRYNLRRWLAACCTPAVILASSLASPFSEEGVGRDSVQRSTVDVRDRPPDELDRPRNRERWTHRGYEIRTNQFTVVANTRVEDARWAAQQMETAWADFGRLADAWMQGHRQPDFGIGAVQVFIDGNAPHDRDLPRTTLSVVGIQTQITLHVAPGQPGLENQLYRLRKGAGEAFLHAAELDRELPPWVCDGLATFVAAKGLTEEEVKMFQQWDKTPGAPRLGGQQWRFQRGEQNRLAVPEFDHDAAAERVKFLLTADDAAHLPAFISAVGESIAVANQRRKHDNLTTPHRGEAQPAKLGPLDQLALDLAKPFEQWQQAPLAGQPKLEAQENTPPEVQRAEREMAVVLKLARRFATAEQRTAHIRITAFHQEQGMTILSRQAKDRPISLPDLYQRMVAPRRTLWGTLNADGQLVLSTDRGALQEMLGLEDNRYAWETKDGRSMLTTTLDGSWKVHGWLEENKEDPSRPLAKFTATKLPTRR
jgi:hypothetical protein